MALVKNTGKHAVQLSSGVSIGPLDTANVDPAAWNEATMIAAGLLTIIDGAIGPPSPVYQPSIAGIPDFAAYTAYPTNYIILHAGTLYRPVIAFVSGAAFSAGDWTAITSGGGGGGAPSGSAGGDLAGTYPNPTLAPGAVDNDDLATGLAATAKGDILAASASGAYARLAVGSDTQVLTADSAQGSGVKWAAGGGSSSVAVTTIAAASGAQVLTVPAGGQAYNVTLTGNWTPTISGAVAGTLCIVDLFLTSDIAGGHVITWPGSVTWVGGTAPPTNVFGQVQVVSLVSFNGGTTWLGSGPGDVVLSSVLTVKGDLVAASGASTPVRVGIGSNGQILAADSTQTQGMHWIDPPQAGPIAKTAITMSAGPSFTTPTNYSTPGYMSFPNGFVSLVGRVVAGVAVNSGDVIIPTGELPVPVRAKLLPVLQSPPVNPIVPAEIAIAITSGIVKYYGPGMAIGDDISFEGLSYSSLV